MQNCSETGVAWKWIKKSFAHWSLYMINWSRSAFAQWWRWWRSALPLSHFYDDHDHGLYEDDGVEQLLHDDDQHGQRLRDDGNGGEKLVVSRSKIPWEPVSILYSPPPFIVMVMILVMVNTIISTTTTVNTILLLIIITIITIANIGILDVILITTIIEYKLRLKMTHKRYHSSKNTNLSLTSQLQSVWK